MPYFFLNRAVRQRLNMRSQLLEGYVLASSTKWGRAWVEQTFVLIQYYQTGNFSMDHEMVPNNTFSLIESPMAAKIGMEHSSHFLAGSKEKEWLPSQNINHSKANRA